MDHEGAPHIELQTIADKSHITDTMCGGDGSGSALHFVSFKMCQLLSLCRNFLCTVLCFAFCIGVRVINKYIEVFNIGRAAVIIEELSFLTAS